MPRRHLSPDKVWKAFAKMGDWLSTQSGCNPFSTKPQINAYQSKKVSLCLDTIPYDILLKILCTAIDVSKERRSWSVLLGLWKPLQWKHLTPPHPLHALSMTNRYLRDVCLPFLFEVISLKCDPSDALEKLRSGKQHLIKSLHITFDRCHTMFPFVPSENFLADFFIFLGSLQKLEKLEINLGQYPDDLRMTQCFLNFNTRLEKLLKVHTLQMIPYNKFVWTMCPNATSLSITDLRTTDFGVPLSAIQKCSTESKTGRIDDFFFSNCVTNYLLTKYELKGDFTRLQYLRINALGEHALLNNLSNATLQLKTIDFTSTEARHFLFSGQDPSFTYSFLSVLSQFNHLQHLILPADEPSAIEGSASYSKDLDNLMRCIGNSCVSLQDVIIKNTSAARILRHDDGRVDEIDWKSLMEVEVQDMFRDERTTFHCQIEVILDQELSEVVL